MVSPVMPCNNTTYTESRPTNNNINKILTYFYYVICNVPTLQLPSSTQTPTGHIRRNMKTQILQAFIYLRCQILCHILEMLKDSKIINRDVPKDDEENSRDIT
jgi:hypothetical protein